MMNHSPNPAEEPLKGNSEGIDNWNDRLDENLEPTDTGDTSADEKAKAYSEQKGSGDQSDESEQSNNAE